MKYRTFVGLEIHIQLLTETKIFCPCRTVFGEEPNTNVCPICFGYPGVLPALNEEAMFKAYQVAAALNCSFSEKAVFERKNYFYPDLPKNYQISQFAHPVGFDGFIEYPFGDDIKKVRIHDVHLEEDAGKMIHAGDMSLLDFNRAGTPLLEIVTEPDLSGGEEAEAFLQYFRRLVRYMEVCDGNMEEGSMRCDANISLNLPEGGLGTKVEIKNLNSSRFVRLALAHEAERQSTILDQGQPVIQETRLWNENRDQTESMRSKEEAQDYRYFPEPDLPPFIPEESCLNRVKNKLPETPLTRMKRITGTWGLSKEQADFICEEKNGADYFEACIRAGADPMTAVSWLASDVQRHLNRTGAAIETSPLTVERFTRLLSMMRKGIIHGKLAKQVLKAIFDEDMDPEDIVKKHGWDAMQEPEELNKRVRKVLLEHPRAVEQYRSGDSKVFGFFMGRIMAETSGRADPELTTGILKKQLKEHLEDSIGETE